MKKFMNLRFLVIFLLLPAACVTVNIYFPAAEVERDAEAIVQDVYSELGEDNGTSFAPSHHEEHALRVFLAEFVEIFVPADAHASDVTTVSNAAIRGLKSQIAGNLKQFAPFLGSGAVGIDRNGYIALRDAGGVPPAQQARLRKLINADRGLRDRLYSEVAKARKTEQVDKVRSIFADTWRKEARGGWFVQDNGGAWRKK
jgi:uncharacterized protein YdbL (DUF1318 family)